MNGIDFEQALYDHFGQIKDFTLGMRIGQYFYELGCRRTAEKYDEIEYNRQKAEQRWLEDRDGCFWDGVAEGKKAMKEQMLKEAVEGEVCIPNVWVEHKEGKELVIRAEISKELGFKLGDKVRIIIVKEDEK